jgi:hypothetical protein
VNNLQAKKGLEYSLRCWLEQPEGRAFLQALNDKKMRSFSDKIMREDTYGDLQLLETTIHSIWDEPSAQPFIEHNLWCAHREAIYRTCGRDAAWDGWKLDIDGIDSLLQTAEQPTIVISPMTLCTDDAMESILTVLRQQQPNRKIICYGEDMDSYLKRKPEQRSIFAEDNVSGIRKILQVLREGGVFLTYPDFVYRQHNAVKGKLFGLPRAFSAGLLKIAMHSDALFLPALSRRQPDGIEIRFFGSVARPANAAASALDRSLQEQVLVTVAGRLLEALILQVPNQWRLLPTLSYNAVEMAD